MSSELPRSRALEDYAVLVRALVPEILGFACHGRDGRIVWGEGTTDAVAADPACRAALDALMHAASTDESRSVRSGDALVWFAPLVSERSPVGVVSLRLPAQADVPKIGALVQPLLRTLARELNLHLRLRDGRRRLKVQAAEEALLHAVESVVHEPRDGTEILALVLQHCHEQLAVGGAVLVVPEIGLRLQRGEGPPLVEVESLLNRHRGDTGFRAGREIWCGSDLLLVPIRRSGGAPGAEQTVIGQLALGGWGDSLFSLRRRARIARYIASHVEYVLGRDYDPLTGLMAWPAFGRRLGAVSGLAGDGLPGRTVMYLDIDRFHAANDTLGRDIGDEILASFGAILRSQLAGQEVTRIAGDSFAALLDADMDAARRHGEAILGRFRELEYHRGGSTYRPSVSIGVGPLATDDDALGGALALAQVACRAAKERGRNRVEVYQPEDHSIIQRLDDMQLVGYIQGAIDRGQLALLGQPIRPTRGTAGGPYYEVLVRLLDEERREISPGEFLSAAERYQLMEELDRWVIASTLRMLAPRARELACLHARFAINLSGQSLSSPTFLEYVVGQLTASGVPPRLVCFEITETVAIANIQRAQAFMHALRRLGCRFSLDDFGAGLSSFGYLKLFPVDTLKIDGGFIRDLDTNVVSQSVVAAISEVARVMQLETVAEYVQRAEVMDLLGRLGVTWAQGYLVGEPAPLRRQLEALHQATTVAAAAAPPAGRAAAQP